MNQLPPISPRDLRTHDDHDRVERIWSRVKDDLPGAARTGSPARAIMLLAAAAAVFGVGIGVGRVTSPATDAVELSAAGDAPLTDVFAAGSQARSFALPRGGKLLLEPDSMVEVVEVGQGHITLSLLRGAASVDATTAEGSFHVVAGAAHVSAPAGSSMSLARRHDDIDVLVSDGSVEVTSPAGRHTVNRGQALAHVPTVALVSSHGEPPPQPVQVAIAPHDRRLKRTPGEPLVPANPDVIAPAPVEPAPPSWMVLADNVKWDEALEALEKTGGLDATIRNAQSARELIALSDVAGQKRPDARIRALRRVADEFGADPLSQAAAMELSAYYQATDKALAAKYGEKAKQAAAFHELALCNEIRNLLDSDSPATAMVSKANEYLSKYPKGSCVEDANTLLEEAGTKKDKPAEPAVPPKQEEAKKPEAKKAETNPPPAPPSAAAPSASASAARPPASAAAPTAPKP